MSEKLVTQNLGEHLIGKKVYLLDGGSATASEASVVSASEGTDVDKDWYSGVVEGAKPVPLEEPRPASIKALDEEGRYSLRFDGEEAIEGSIETITRYMDGPSTEEPLAGATAWVVFVPASGETSSASADPNTEHTTPYYEMREEADSEVDEP